MTSDLPTLRSQSPRVLRLVHVRLRQRLIAPKSPIRGFSLRLSSLRCIQLSFIASDFTPSWSICMLQIMSVWSFSQFESSEINFKPSFLIGFSVKIRDFRLLRFELMQRTLIACFPSKHPVKSKSWRESNEFILDLRANKLFFKPLELHVAFKYSGCCWSWE